jgi:hypothetical protein
MVKTIIYVMMTTVVDVMVQELLTFLSCWYPYMMTMLIIRNDLQGDNAINNDIDSDNDACSDFAPAGNDHDCVE